MVTTTDPAVDGVLRKARVHGGTKTYHHDFVGWNSRLDSLQAAVLLAKLPHLETWNRRRRELADGYGRLFAEAGLSPEPVRLPVVRDDAEPVFHQYTIRAERRDELRAFLGERGIGSNVFYPLPLHLQQCFAELGGRRGQLPASERASEEVLSLPMYPELGDRQQQRVVESIAAFYRG
jgi:dTDP-4-amino-4,6-dideoxygalactose transaminase